MNWTALGSAAFGGILGGLGGALIAGYRNRQMGTPALVGASLGAILGAAFAPKSAGAKTLPVTGPGGLSIAVTPGGNAGVSITPGTPLVLNVPGQPTSASSDTPDVLALESVDVISATFKALAPGDADATVSWVDLKGNPQTSTVPVHVVS